MVRRDLQNGSDLRTTGELRIGDGVGAVWLADQEVRVAEKPAVEQDSLYRKQKDSLSVVRWKAWP